MFLFSSGLSGFAFAGDDDGAHAEVVQGVVDGLLAVAAVGGDGAWRAGFLDGVAMRSARRALARGIPRSTMAGFGRAFGRGHQSCCELTADCRKTYTLPANH